MSVMNVEVVCGGRYGMKDKYYAGLQNYKEGIEIEPTIKIVLI